MSQEAIYPSNPNFVKKAHVSGMDAYRALYDRAKERPEEFWAEIAEQEVHWFQKWSHVFEWNPPFCKWFVNAKTNIAYNCLDRHVAAGNGDKVAIHWEGEPGDSRTITYAELSSLVQRFANVLKGRGLKAGDRSIIYMPMIPELPIALLACARLGITHSVVFGGFSAEALKALYSGPRRCGRDHCRWRLAAGEGSSPQGRGGRSGGRVSHGEGRHRRAANEGRCSDAGGARSLVA
jgi:acetyl-CoA synthetase